jgi:RNA polymerase sigma factor (sigma-70 family)
MTYTTNYELLQKMRSGDSASWELFREFYRPLIARRGMDFGLSPAEVDTLIQDVMVVFFQNRVLDKYEQGKGRFRSYLRTITTRCALRLRKAREDSREIQEGELDIPDATDEALFKAEWEEFILEKAYQELRETMDSAKYMAFQMHSIQGRSAAEVAEIFGMNRNQVYLLCSRTLKSLKEIVARLQEELG